MNQRAFLASFDAAAFGGFLATGIADAATYLSPAALAAMAAHDPDDPESPPLPDPVPCTVLVDRSASDDRDDLAPVNINRTRVSFQQGEVAPEPGGQVTILDANGDAGETFSLVQRTRADESLSGWWVQPQEGDDA